MVPAPALRRLLTTAVLLVPMVSSRSSCPPALNLVSATMGVAFQGSSQ